MNNPTKMTSEESRELLRQALLKHSASRHDQSIQRSSTFEPIAAIIHDVNETVKSKNRQPDWSVVVEYWSELRRIGALSNLECRADDVRSIKNIETLALTTWGRKLLEGAESSPNNPERYFAELRKRIGSSDGIALVYLEEAVAAWAAGLNRSSAVMLGCACERLVRMLAIAVQKAEIEPGAKALADHESKVIAGKAAPMGISAVYENVRKALQSCVDGKKLPGNLTDGLDRRLSSIFDHARMLRNRSGHPTGEEVSSEDAHAGLLLFPGFHETVTRLVEALGELKTS